MTIQVTVDRGDPFTDITDHWSQPFVTQLYQMGLTTGIQQEDGSYIYAPDGQITRGELLVFISRMLGVDTAQYESVALPFADAEEIADWVLPHVKAMYALQVFNGVSDGGQLYADVDDLVDRQSAMTMLGRVLEQQVSYDLSAFADADQVADWASAYVQTLVARGHHRKQQPAHAGERDDPGEMAKVIVLVSQLPHAELTPRGEEPEQPEEPTQPEEPAESQDPSDPEQPGESTDPGTEETEQPSEETGGTEGTDGTQPSEAPED